MKAPIDQQRALLDLQAADSRSGRIEALLKALPEAKEAADLAAAASDARRSLAQIESERDDADRELARIEEDAVVVRARIARDRDRLAGSSSVKDIQGLESELAALSKRLSDLEDMELAIMERTEEITARLDAATAEHDRIRAAQDDADARAAARRSELAAEQLVVREDRDRIASGIGAELLALYDRQRSRYGVGAALLRGGVSGGSGVELHESDLATIRAAAPDDVILDPDGSCILVRTEESGL